MAHSTARDPRLVFRRVPSDNYSEQSVRSEDVGEEEELTQTKPSEQELMLQLYPDETEYTVRTEDMRVGTKRKRTKQGPVEVNLPLRKDSADADKIMVKSENVTRKASSTSTHLTVRVRMLESQNATLASENAALVSKSDALSSEKVTLASQNTEKNAKIVAQKSAHAVLSRENATLAKEKVKIHGSLKNMTESHATMTKSHSHRVTEKNLLIEQEAKLWARIAESEEQNLRSDALMAKMTQREEGLLRKTEQADSEKAQLEQEKISLQQENQALRQEQSPWAEQQADLRRKNESLRGENEALRRDNTDLIARDRHRFDRIVEIESLVEDLRRGSGDKGRSRFRGARDERSRSPLSGDTRLPTGPRAERRGR